MKSLLCALVCCCWPLAFAGCEGSVQGAVMPDLRGEVAADMAFSIHAHGAPAPSPNKVPRSKCQECLGTGYVGDGTVRVPCGNCVPDAPASEPWPAEVKQAEVKPAENEAEADANPFEPDAAPAAPEHEGEPAKLVGCDCGNPDCQCEPGQPCDAKCACCGHVAPSKVAVVEPCSARIAGRRAGAMPTMKLPSNAEKYPPARPAVRVVSWATKAPCTNGTCPAMAGQAQTCGPNGCGSAGCASDGPGDCGSCGARYGGWYPGKHLVVRPLARAGGWFREHRPVRRALGAAGRFLWRCRPGIVFRRGGRCCR